MILEILEFLVILPQEISIIIAFVGGGGLIALLFHFRAGFSKIANNHLIPVVLVLILLLVFMSLFGLYIFARCNLVIAPDLNNYTYI